MNQKKKSLPPSPPASVPGLLSETDQAYIMGYQDYPVYMNNYTTDAEYYMYDKGWDDSELDHQENG